MANEHDYKLGPESKQFIDLLAGALGCAGKSLAQKINTASQRTLDYESRHANEASAPRPRRWVDMGREKLAQEVLGHYYPAYVEALASPLPILAALQEAVEKRRLSEDISLSLRYRGSGDTPSVVLMAAGLGLENVMESRFVHRKGVIIDVAPELHELLGQTDVSDDLPWSQLRLPYPAIYVHLPLSEHAKFVTMSSEEGGMTDKHIDGFYVFEDMNEDGQRAITVHLIQNLEGQHAPIRNSFLGITLADEEHSIQQTIDRYLREFSPEQTADGRWVESAKSIFSYLSKVMLYMSLPDRREMFVKERSEADKRSRAAPAGIVRKKREAKAEGLYDRIVIGQGIEHAPTSEGGSDSGQRAVHWRRGHFRGQRIGAGRKGIKTVWVRPAIIGLKSADTLPQKKHYELQL